VSAKSRYGRLTFLIQLVRFCRKQSVPMFILGGGTNTVGMDKPYDGLVIRLCQNDFIRVINGRTLPPERSRRCLANIYQKSLAAFPALPASPEPWRRWRGYR
jgi:hypothetical protein